MKPLAPSRFVLALGFLAFAPLCFAQSDKAATSDDKAEQIVQRALKAVGGDRYLQVKTQIGRGLFTEYRDGVSGIPSKFVDYISFPDKERTEFAGGGGTRIIQSNYRDGGWIYDGAALTLKDQTPQQLEEFKLVMRVTAENLLRGWWRQQSAILSYVGRREAGVGRRNETVRLTYPDEFWIEYEFADDNLPAKILYQRKLKNRDTEEIEAIKEEDRLHKRVTIDGVTAPFIVDHYRNGIQTSRIAFDTIEYNKPLADSLFAKPANFKAVK